MSEMDYETAAADPEPEPDPRVIAVHRVVDLERQHERAAYEAEKAQKMAAIVREELREAKDALSGLLGYPSNSGTKAMSAEEAKRLAYQARASR